MKSIIIFFFIFSITCAQEGKFDTFNYRCTDGKIRPYIVYTPKNFPVNKKKPLIVFLHGSVSSPQLKKDPLDYIKKSKWVGLADRGGFFLLFCYGQQGATWFDEVGQDMIFKEIEVTKEEFNIDADKVFLSGFSDGGSGVLYTAMTNPFLFAGFIAMNGSLPVAAKLGKNGIFPQNSNNIPIYVINTTEDPLYPINQMTPVTGYLKQFNRNIIYKTPKGGHEMAYFDGEKDSLLTFIRKNSRISPFNASVETAVPARFSFISITKIDTESSSQEWHKKYSLKIFNDKADFGISYDYSFKGKGLKVSSIKNDSTTAGKMGIKKGDVILQMEDDIIKNAYDPFFYLIKKKAGDSTYVKILRENKALILSGKFNPGYYYEVFPQDLKMGKIVIVTKNREMTIKTSRVSELTLDFNSLKKQRIKLVKINEKYLSTKLKGVQKVEIQDQSVTATPF
ncbi:phospholipase [Chryseobacterium fluminis]|uniref:phospholipase n=1 Tax=Chryseobacterium fluminis TaxID=2983606 RepID=UPI0022582171|nr:phospholipase [Chryseobacterium sp. MMS21-Ot14]UZT97908.1 phospholipase [Chryseobacterium sp. MMS21-Ot14]